MKVTMRAYNKKPTATTFSLSRFFVVIQYRWNYQFQKPDVVLQESNKSQVSYDKKKTQINKEREK